MRVFFLSAAEFLSDYEPNGEALIAWNLLAELCSRGHEVVACVKQSRISQRAPFEIVEIGPGSSRESLSAHGYASAACTELQRRSPGSFDVAHWLFPDGGWGLSKRRLPRNLPLVVGPLVMPWTAPRRWWPPGRLVEQTVSPLLLARQKRLLQRASRVLIAYPDVRSRLPVGALERSVELPFGVPRDATPDTGLPKTPRVLFVGRLEVSKGVIDLLDAAVELRAELGSFEMAFIGSGTLLPAFPALVAQRGLASHVRLLGRLIPERVAVEMAASSVVCLPSHGEPFGMALLEAMRAGRAVVATNEAGPASIVVDGVGGRLVSPRQPTQLASALMSLLSDRTRLRAAGDFNRRCVEERYSLSTVVDRLESVYWLVSGKRSGTCQRSSVAA